MDISVRWKKNDSSTISFKMQQRQYRENQNKIYINKLNQSSQSGLKNGNKQSPLSPKKHHNDRSKHRKISRKNEAIPLIAWDTEKWSNDQTIAWNPVKYHGKMKRQPNNLL